MLTPARLALLLLGLSSAALAQDIAVLGASTDPLVNQTVADTLFCSGEFRRVEIGRASCRERV